MGSKTNGNGGERQRGIIFVSGKLVPKSGK